MPRTQQEYVALRDMSHAGVTGSTTDSAALLETSIHTRRERRWKVFRRKINLFLRAIGLSIFSYFFAPEEAEHKKVIIETSIWVALAQCSVHVLPLVGSIVLCWLNFSGFYVGAQLSGSSSMSDDVKFQMLQFAAKAHELFIIASVANIVFHVVRNELFWGNGIPLGLIASGFSFSELSFFW
jgi:hypothetical protein